MLGEWMEMGMDGWIGLRGRRRSGAERSGPSAVGEISDCNGDRDGQVGSLWSAIGLFVLGLLARELMLSKGYAQWLQVPLLSKISWVLGSIILRCGAEHSLPC